METDTQYKGLLKQRFVSFEKINNLDARYNSKKREKIQISKAKDKKETLQLIPQTFIVSLGTILKKYMLTKCKIQNKQTNF